MECSKQGLGLEPSRSLAAGHIERSVVLGFVIIGFVVLGFFFSILLMVFSRCVVIFPSLGWADKSQKALPNLHRRVWKSVCSLPSVNLRCVYVPFPSSVFSVVSSGAYALIRAVTFLN